MYKIDRGSFYHSWEMRLLFFNLVKDMGQTCPLLIFEQTTPNIEEIENVKINQSTGCVRVLSADLAFVLHYTIMLNQ